MKSLLIVTEAFDIGGLETHIRGEIIALTQAGCRVHLATGHRFNSLLLPQEVASVTNNLKLGPEATLIDFMNTVAELRQLIRVHTIECIHAHPFTSLLPSLVAAELERVPFALTLHGPASLCSYGPLYDFILTSVILPNAGLVVGVSEEVAALASPYLHHGEVFVLPNGVDVNTFPQTISPQEIDPRWLIVSRLDLFKIVGIADFISKAKAAGLPGVLLVGDGPGREALQQRLELDGLADFVEFCGMSADVPRLMQSIAGVAGMGRVVLEGLASRKPVCLVGYDGVKGLVDQNLFAWASHANFSGRNLSNIDNVVFCEQFERLSKINASALYELVSTEFSEPSLWRGFLENLKTIGPQKPTLLSDTYRTLLASGVNETAPLLQSVVLFEQLGRITHSPRYFDSGLVANFLYHQGISRDMTFKQTVAERDGQIAGLNQVVVERDGQIAGLNHVVVERDGQIAGLNQAVVERDGQIAGLCSILQNKESEIFMVKTSISWALTRPLRFIKILVKSPKKANYDLAKFIFWRLSPATRQLLQGPRHKFIRWVKSTPAPDPVNREIIGCGGDLNWVEFSTQVLSRRGEYKGIFVQEIVIDWHVPLYQRPQHIACALGRLGYLVVYKTANWSNDSVSGFRNVAPNVWLTNSSKIDGVSGAVHSFYSTAYSIPPELILEKKKSHLIIYEYIDHIDPQISGDSENIRRLLALKDFAFSGGADYVVASARKLASEAAEAVGFDKVILAQNGVDTRHYRDPIHQSAPIPENYSLFRKKYTNIVGYFGALAPWLWYEAVSALVEARPDLGFVFIGPDYYGGVEKLPKAENILYLGTVDYKILPSYARKFDVCFIPFAPGEIARTTSPLKLYEYFALEKPVVVTSEMSECVAFKEVFSGDSPETLSLAIDKAIQIKNNEIFQSRLAQLADENDWDERARSMETIFTKQKEKL